MAAVDLLSLSFQLTTNDVPHRQCAAELRILLQRQQQHVAASTVAKTARGVLFSAPATVAPTLAKLTLPEKVYGVVLDLPVAQLPPPDDDTLLSTIALHVASASGWAAALHAHRITRKTCASDTAVSFAVVGNRRGSRFKESISSLKLGELCGGALHERFGWPVDLNRPALQVNISLNDSGLFVSIALLRRTDAFDCRTVGGLDPHTSWAMVRSLGPLIDIGRPLVLDPMCGKAALLLEALNLWPHCVALGIDCDDGQLRCATANRAALPPPLRERLSLLRGDAGALPLADEACDALACDLPFEVSSRFGYHLDTSRGSSLERLLSEWARVLKPAAHAVLLTSEAQLPPLLKAIDTSRRLRVLCERPCPLGFTSAVIVVAVRVQEGAKQPSSAPEVAPAAMLAAAAPAAAPAATLDDTPAAMGAAASDGAEPSHGNACGKPVIKTSRLPWEAEGGRRQEWHVLRKADRAPMVPWGVLGGAG